MKADKVEAFSILQSKIFFIIFVLLAAVLPSAACHSKLAHPASNPTAREATDDLGRKIKIPARIERVVSLAPSLTENVFAVGGGEKLVGVTSYCDYPAEAQKIAKIGDTINPNLEAIVAQKPQLVLVTTASQIESFTQRMEDRGIAVFVTNPKNLEDVLRNLRQFGEFLETTEKAEQLVRNLQKRISDIENRVKNENTIRTFIQISPEPFTVGRDSFVTDLIRRAGGESVTKDVAESYPRISKETALASQPEAIILSAGGAMGEGNNEPADIFKESPAVKNNRVYKINGDFLARPGTRLVDGLEEIARALHPQVFDK
ncbi:MAG: cobalamin-binding protein [Acidobacteriota bacterium]|nr:cobalamin-binding protein [Acidobacteriota bacterium]